MTRSTTSDESATTLFDGPAASPVRKAAVISEDGVYRYTLERIWDEAGELCLFVMLNPSTADAAVDDPTIRRCMSFARRWGYGGLLVGNLYAYRATDPKCLDTVPDPVGPENWDHLFRLIERADEIIVAWGANPNRGKFAHRVRVQEWGPMGQRYVKALKVTKNGQPGHPLYVRADAERVLWSNWTAGLS